MKYYAVKKGRIPGIYTSWSDCQKQTNSYPDNEYKGFTSLSEAKKWLKTPGSNTQTGTRQQRIQKVPKPENAPRPETLNQEQKRALKKLLSGENIFLTGEAGTGKSYLLRCFLRQVSGKNVIACAPTGIAALQLGGATIHRAFGAKTDPFLPDKKIRKVKDAIRTADIIVIDEISMCRFDLFEFVCRSIEKAQEISKRKKQLIVVGDFYQLPPVIKAEDRAILQQTWGNFGEGFAFYAPGWTRMNFSPVVLKEVVRQKNDTGFVLQLNRIRSGDSGAIEWFHTHTAEVEQKGIFIYGTNAAVDEMNLEKAKQIPGKRQTYVGIKSGIMHETPASLRLELAVGIRVMSIINDIQGRYQNGSLGTVSRLEADSVTVRFDNGKTARLEKYTWEAVDYQVVTDPSTQEQRLQKEVIGTFEQLPLKIAFAVTIHKSQGQTYDSANLDPSCFGEGQLYVALSRVTNASTLHLLQPIRPSDLRLSKAAVEFYAGLESQLS